MTKRCDNCKYGKIDTRNTLPILCLKSIRRIKSKKCIKYSFHSCDDKCRNWENAEDCDDCKYGLSPSGESGLK